MQNIYSDRFKIYSFYAKEEFFDDDSHSYRGRINSSFVENLVSDIEYPSKHYICGSVGLKNRVKQSLINSGQNIDNVYSETLNYLKTLKISKI